MVVSASAGSLSGNAGANAGVSGNGMAASYDWNAEYEAGYDQVGIADHPGASFSTSTTDNSQAGAPPPHPALAQVKAAELKVSGKVTGPSDGTGFAQAIASVRALVNRDFEELGAAQTELTAETWIFASTHTYAGDEGVTATASATASGTAKASAATPELGSILSESKGKATAASSTTFADGESSSAVSAAMIGAASHIDVGSAMAGYPSYMYTPISLFHPFPAFDPIVYPYFYPGNGLATANLLEGTGYAKSSASGSATASADYYYVWTSSGSGCEPLDEPTVMTSSSGTVASGVSGTDTAAGAISGINAWAFAEEPAGLIEDYLPSAALDAGSTIFSAGGAIDEPTGPAALSKNGKMKTGDTATFSASGKSSGIINLGDDLSEIKVSQLENLIANLDATTSGSISGSATQDGGGASGSANVIAARALGIPLIGEPEDPPGIDWGILLPSIQELNMITWDLGAGEGMLYSILGSASGSTQEDGNGATSATISGSAMASGDGRELYAIPAPFSDGGNGEDPIFPEPGISGTASAKGTIKSSANALPFGEAATTSQIFAGGGEGPLFGGVMVDYGDPELFMDFSSEVGGMAYLTTMDYAASGSVITSVTSTSKKSSKIPTTSATSSVSGSAGFEGSSVIVDQVALPVEPNLPVLIGGEVHEASASSKGTVTGTASASNIGEADTGSLIFSAAMAELSTDGLEDAIVDYSLILSDSSAVSEPDANTASAKGTAEGSTTAASSLEYTDFETGEPVYLWLQFLESTTAANGKMATEATAAGWSSGRAVSTLKSYNAVEPAEYSVDFDPFPPFTLLSPATINDDSVLASAAEVWGKEGSAEKSSAMGTLSGSTSSDGSHSLTLEELVLPETSLGGTMPVKPLLPEWEEVFRESINGGTSVSNSDKVSASGQGTGQGNYEAEAFSYACADQMTVLAPDGKVALAQGIFGTYASADTTTHIIDGVKSEATISKVQVNAYADPPPPDIMAEIGIKGGKASAKVTSAGEMSTPATYGALTKKVYPEPPGGTADDGDNNAACGIAYSWHGVIADSRTDPPTLGDPPTADILHPAVFWS